MELVAIAYFFAVILGLGYSAKKLLKLDKFKDILEEIIFILGLGLGSFILLYIPLNLIQGLFWQVFLIIALIIPLYSLGEKIKQNKLKLNFSNIAYKNYLIVGLITLAFFYVYLTGAFGYPYLEDDDPWGHAVAAKYVSMEHTYTQPDHLPIHYLEPYPPFYASMMGVLHQVHPESVQWVLKFFNVLLITLGLPFAYIWLRKFTKSDNIALTGTFLLAVLPCFMNHFIWAQTLALVLWFPALYSIEKMKEEKNKKWVVVAILTISAILITQPSVAVVFGLFYASYFFVEFAIQFLKKESKFNIIKVFKNKEIKYLFLGGLLGLSLALSIYWIPVINSQGLEEVLSSMGATEDFFKDMSVYAIGGDLYGIQDFAIAPNVSKMDQATGLGLVIFILLLFSVLVLLYQRKKLITPRNKYLLVSLLWLIIGFIGIEGNALPYKLMPHRFWVFFAIPVVVLVAWSIILIYNSTKKDKAASYIIISLIFVGILVTSAYPKYVVQTSQWPPGVGWISNEQIQGYVGLKELPPNTMVYSLCKNPKTVIGVDKMDYTWIKEIEDYKKVALNDTIDNNYKFLKKYDYSYLIIDGGCVKDFGLNQTNLKIQEIFGSGKFRVEEKLSNGGFFLFKIL
ncbi:MAG: hypothetical protein KAT28_04050 [Candidatus Aenigmarchaeota archaeon]|nr:hypothetical protein [Candidatus Aenigmarchaeota archaeon]